MNQHPEIIIFIGNPINAAIAAVLPLFLKTPITTQPPATTKIPKTALLILNDTQLTHLPPLRLQNFSGPVITIATNPHSNPSQKHRILRWGQQSHATFTSPYHLPELLTTIENLVPLQPENLKMLQNELTAPQRWFKTHILPALHQLTITPTDTTQLATIISQIRAKTPVTCHATIQIARETAQIQQHLTRNLQHLTTHPDQTPETLDRLRQTFDRWRDITISGGEGLGTFT